MRNIYIKLFGALSLIVALASCSVEEPVAGVADVKPAVAPLTDDVVPGELLVRFDARVSQVLEEAGVVTKSGQTDLSRSGVLSVDQILDMVKGYQIERVFPVDKRTEDTARQEGLHLWYRVRFSEEFPVNEVAEKLSALGEVSLVSYNRTIKRKSAKATPLTVQQLNAVTSGVDGFNDPLLKYQWHLVNNGDQQLYPGSRQDGSQAGFVAGADVNVKAAWDKCKGDPSIIVAVLDEGVMWSHPDLAGNMWVNEAEEFNSKEDRDGNGYAGDRYGYNFVKDSPVICWSETYDTGHGTHVAGTIAAVNGNGEGVRGVAGGNGAPNTGVRIMSCQVIDGMYSVTLAQEARAIKYAADNGAVILQCSWGYNSALANMMMGYTPGPGSEEEWGSLYPLEKDALDYFIHNAGSPNGVIEGGIAIFAAGNEYAAMPAFPSAYSKCLSVAAISADFTPAGYTDYGVEVDFSAPGGDTEYYGAIGDNNDGMQGIDKPNGSILSTLVINGQANYGYYEGTSMSCPHVSGVAALGLSYAAKMRRHFKAEEFIELMKSTARDLDSKYAGQTKIYHYNHSSAGYSTVQMNLNDYRGKMGRLIDAGALLRAIDGPGNVDGKPAGSDMRVPNIVVAPREKQTIDLVKYFVGGENFDYIVKLASTTVADAAIVDYTKLVVTGLEPGVTTATIEVHGANSQVVAKQTIAITVRKAGENGWM